MYSIYECTYAYIHTRMMPYGTTMVCIGEVVAPYACRKSGFCESGHTTQNTHTPARLSAYTTPPATTALLRLSIVIALTATPPRMPHGV